MTARHPKDPAADQSRRILVAGAGSGLALAATSAAAQTEANLAAAGRASVPVLKDPVHEYPAPPFAKQHQPWPGLASKMNPCPDHGEQSYKGSGRLAGRKALITGGDSGIGRAAGIALAREGADAGGNYYHTREPAHP